MSDILDVMNIKSFPKKKKAEKETTPDQATIQEQRQIYAPEEYASANKKRKLSAMNRELYNLIGSNIPPMAIDTDSAASNIGGKKFKERLVTTKKNAPWRKLGFNNSARDDGLVLYHWTKAAKAEKTETVNENSIPEEEEKKELEVEKVIELDPNEYRYAKYNTKLSIPEFTEEEYNEACELEKGRLEKEEEVRVAKEKSKQEAKEMKIKKEKEEEDAKEEIKKADAKKKNDDKKSDKKTSKNEGSVDVDSKEGESAIDDSKKKELTEESKESTVEGVSHEKKDSVGSDKKEGTDKEGEVVEEEEKEIVKVSRPWSYEETQTLFELCSRYDMRWAVIYDRYQDIHDDRSIEDLKVQMYTISAAILEKRADPNDTALIKSLRSFDKEKEVSRKFYLDKLIHRAPTEIAEEESLVIEARKFELAAKKMLYERGQLLQLLDSPQSSASVQQYLTSQGLTQLYNSLMASDKSRKRKAEVPVAPLLGPNAIPHTQHIMMSNSQQGLNGVNNGNVNIKDTKRRTISKQSNVNVNIVNSENKNDIKLSEVQQLLDKNLSSEELEVYGIEIHTDRIQPGVHVRSQKIASFKPSVQAKVHEILGQLGLSIKPNLPTGPVSKKFDELLYKISHLVDLKKQSDKLVAEIELIKRQKGIN